MPSHAKIGVWKILVIGLLLFVPPVSGELATKPAAGAHPMVRTELYFGAVPKDQWDNFLARVVTPLFPEGLTWYDVQGQWRAPDGVTRKLPSRMLIVIYADTVRNDLAIERVRQQFKKQFHHLAVLRVSMKVQAADDDWHPNPKLNRSAQYRQ
jgi:Protein of unknown function (DUF3574)